MEEKEFMFSEDIGTENSCKLNELVWKTRETSRKVCKKKVIVAQ